MFCLTGRHFQIQQTTLGDRNVVVTRGFYVWKRLYQICTINGRHCGDGSSRFVDKMKGLGAAKGVEKK